MPNENYNPRHDWIPADPLPDTKACIFVEKLEKRVPFPPGNKWHVLLLDRPRGFLELYIIDRKQHVPKVSYSAEDLWRAAAFRCAERFVSAVREGAGRAYYIFPPERQEAFIEHKYEGDTRKPHSIWKPGDPTGGAVWYFGAIGAGLRMPPGAYRTITKPLYIDGKVCVGLYVDHALPGAPRTRIGSIYQNVPVDELTVLPDFAYGVGSARLMGTDPHATFAELDSDYCRLWVAFASDKEPFHPFFFQAAGEYLAADRGELGPFVEQFIDRRLFPNVPVTPDNFGQALVALGKYCGASGEVKMPEDVRRFNTFQAPESAGALNPNYPNTFW